MISVIVFAFAVNQIAADDVLPSNYTAAGHRNLELTPKCNGGYYDKTGGNAKYWACGKNCPGGKYWTDGVCNCACLKPTTAAPTNSPTNAPTDAPTAAPTAAPTDAPTAAPTAAPTDAPTAAPTKQVREIFDFYDNNNDGTVNLADLKEKKMYMKIWGEHNADSVNPLTFDDVKKSKNEYFTLWEEIKNAAKALDVNNNGKINSHDLNVMLDERKHANDQLAKYQAQLKTAEQNLGRPLDISFEALDAEVAGYVADFNKRMDESFEKLGGSEYTEVPHNIFDEYLKDVSFLLCFLEKVEAHTTTTPHLTAAEFAACLSGVETDVATAGGVEMAEFAKLTNPGKYNTAFAQAGARTAELEM